MSINELDGKVAELRELRSLVAEIKAEITAIEDQLRAALFGGNENDR